MTKLEKKIVKSAKKVMPHMLKRAKKDKRGVRFLEFVWSFEGYICVLCYDKALEKFIEIRGAGMKINFEKAGKKKKKYTKKELKYGAEYAMQYALDCSTIQPIERMNFLKHSREFIQGYIKRLDTESNE